MTYCLTFRGRIELAGRTQHAKNHPHYRITDGIGLETSKSLYSQRHHILLHGRNDTKLKASAKALSELSGDGRVESYLADLSRMAGNDIQIGADILVRAALSDEFANASGKYFDNDKGRFASPHPDAQDQKKLEGIVRVIETVLARIT